MKAKKTYQMLVTVRAPANLHPRAIRREVRTLINDQCYWSLDAGEMKAVSVEPAPRGKA